MADPCCTPAQREADAEDEHTSLTSDQARELIAAIGWPVGPSEAQHPWEAPRTAQGVPRRPARLRALGNAVVPQVGYVIGQAIREVLDG